jgi:penicillin amidase
MIPVSENPHVFNPAQGFVASANECVTDSTYPYWYNGDFIEFRAWRINQLLRAMPKAGIEDMFRMQNDDYSILAARLIPLLSKHITEFRNEKEKQRFQKLTNWNCHLDASGIEASIFQVWWYYFYNKAWAGFSNVPALHYPLPERTLQLLELADSLHTGIPQFGDLKTVANISFRQAMDSLGRAEKGGIEWYKVKNTTIRHLTKLPAFSCANLKIGGWGNTINAAKSNHGPSWRLVVEMGKDIQAFGIYPGGQSGNPGSKYYSTFVNQWADGKYYWLNFLPNQAKQDDRLIKYTWTVNK